MMTFSISAPTEHFGACDGSAAIACGEDHFIGASDERNVLSLFPVEDGSRGRPLLDLNDALGITPKEKHGILKFPECDLEGAARIGDRIYWLGSHAADEHGKPRSERQVLVATQLGGVGEGGTLAVVGKPCRRLLPDMLEFLARRGLDLGEAAGRPPKTAGALNIESLCADGEVLYLGFRNPVPHDLALLLPLSNASDLIENGGQAIFQEPIHLDLAGLGIRDMAGWRDRFLVIAGDFRDRFDADARPSQLYAWKPSDNGATTNLGIDFGDLNPEALVPFAGPTGDRVLILSDDGARRVGGVVTKDLPDERQSFRSVWLEAG